MTKVTSAEKRMAKQVLKKGSKSSPRVKTIAKKVIKKGK